MNFQQFLFIFRSRYKAVLSVLLGTMVLAIILSFVLPPIYKATSSVVVDVKSPDPMAGIYATAMAAPGYMTTQADILTSDRVTIRVIKMLKLDESPAVRQQWLDATNGKGSLDVWLATLLEKKLDVKSSPDSNVLNIVFSGEDPDFSAAVSNAYAQAYIDANIDLQVEPARQYSLWFDDRLKVLRTNLEQAQANLSNYQQQTGIVIADQNMDLANAKLSQLTGQLAQAEGQTADTESRNKHQGASDTMQEVLMNPVIQSIKSQIIQLEAKRDDLGIGINHPQYKAMQDEIDTLKQKLANETSIIVNGISTSNRVNKQRERELKGSIQQQKESALGTNKQRDKMTVLQSEVLAAQKAYDALAQRASEVNLQSHSNQTNVSILSQATPPVKPWFPNMPLNVIGSVILGLIFGLGFAFIRETRDSRVRTIEDMDILFGLPVLAQFRLPPSKRRFLKFAGSSGKESI